LFTTLERRADLVIRLWNTIFIH